VEDVLVIAKLPPAHLAYLDENFTCHRLFEAEDRAAFIDGVKDKVRAVVTNGFGGYDRALVEALPYLEIISVWGAGLQALDLDVARERRIVVTNTPDNSKIAVAELGIALLLAAARRITEAHEFVKSGAWASEAFARPGTGLFGKTCGIVALGTIGRAVAERAAAFQMNVLYFGPRKKDDVPYAYFDDVTAMASGSDFLILCCPELPATRGLITADVLRALGPDGILVNIARGAIVDEPALIEALRNKTIKAAGLDVFADEPNVPEALRKLDNVILVPHIGTNTADILEIRRTMCVANLKAYFSGQPVPAPVHVPKA